MEKCKFRWNQFLENPFGNKASFFCIFIFFILNLSNNDAWEKGKISCEYVPAIKIDWGKAKFAKIIKNFLKVLSILISHNSHEGRESDEDAGEWLGGHKVKYFSDFLTCSFFYVRQQQQQQHCESEKCSVLSLEHLNCWMLLPNCLPEHLLFNCCPFVCA